jgi:hypothetical protein
MSVRDPGTEENAERRIAPDVAYADISCCAFLLQKSADARRRASAPPLTVEEIFRSLSFHAFFRPLLYRPLLFYLRLFPFAIRRYLGAGTSGA